MRWGAPAWWAVVGLSALSGCSLDGLLLSELNRQDHLRLPDPAPQTLRGVVAAGGGAQVGLWQGNGVPIAGLQTTAASAGSFSLELDGATSLSNAVVAARQGAQLRLALVPELPAQPSVLAPPRTFELADLSPGALQIDAVSTALALLLHGKLASQGQGLTGTAGAAVTSTLIAVHKKWLAGQPELVAFGAVVGRIGIQLQGQPGEPPLRLGQGVQHLDAARVQQLGLDLDGDGAADGSTAAYDGALKAALATFNIEACYETHRIRVVLQTRLDNGKDGNCLQLDPYLWTAQSPGKTVFVTGGIHKDTPLCRDGVTSGCLSQTEVDAANTLLGNWKPNSVQMYDDGSHGDAVAGDGTWTIAVDLPWFATTGTQAPVRVAYKFTYGRPGQGWTDSEEFPGNQRLLELVDVNGDHLVTRFDRFADETTNKDKKNGLSPANGGCGTVTWPAASAADCVSDTRERPVDLDGDCQADGWPTVAVPPLAVACPTSP